MKKILAIILIAVCLPAKELRSQILSRYTTKELLIQAKSSDSDFTVLQPGINFALPLIDSSVAVQIARLFGISGDNAFTNAITIQCRDSVLKQILLKSLIEHDKLCNAALIEKNEYDHLGPGIYEYWWLTNLLLAQTCKGDTSLLKTAISEFEFWAPYCLGFIDTVMKPGMNQLTIGKKKFNPCLLASFGNTRLWASCIYLITGKDEYNSANEQLNKVYEKVMGAGKGKNWTDNRKEFVSLGKMQMINLATAASNTLESLDFEKIPVIKEKLDDVRKKHNWNIRIYTHENKALLFLYYIEQGMIGFTKKSIGISSLYLLELTSPSMIQLSIINVRDRFY